MRVAFSDPQGARALALLPYAGPARPLPVRLLRAVGGRSGRADRRARDRALSSRRNPAASSAKAQDGELETGPGYVDDQERRDALAADRRTSRSSAARPHAPATGILFTLAHAKRDQPIIDRGRVRRRRRTHPARARHRARRVRRRRLAHRLRRSPARPASGAAPHVPHGLAIAGLGFFVSHEAAGIAGADARSVRVPQRHPQPRRLLRDEGHAERRHGGRGTAHPDQAGLVHRAVRPRPRHRGGRRGRSASACRRRITPSTSRPPATALGAGLGPDDRDALMKQIMSASARARGLGDSKKDVTGRVDALRRNGESPRDWLARLDMAGRMLEASTAGYRGHTLDTEDLWAILEDPEAEADLRAAAARVLRHSQKPETRTAHRRRRRRRPRRRDEPPASHRHPRRRRQREPGARHARRPGARPPQQARQPRRCYR